MIQKKVIAMNKILKFSSDLIKDIKDSLYICAAGFEDRVKGIIKNLKGVNRNVFKYSIILEYHSSFSNKKQNNKQEFLA